MVSFLPVHLFSVWFCLCVQC